MSCPTGDYPWCRPCCHPCHSEDVPPTRADHLLPLWRKRSLPDQLPETESRREERHCCRRLRRKGRSLVKLCISFSPCACCFFRTYCLVSFVGECQNIWALHGKLTRLIILVITFDILMSYLQINILYSYPAISSHLDLVCTHPSFVVT